MSLTHQDSVAGFYRADSPQVGMRFPHDRAANADFSHYFIFTGQSLAGAKNMPVADSGKAVGKMAYQTLCPAVPCMQPISAFQQKIDRCVFQ